MVSGPQGGNIMHMNSNRHLKFIPNRSVTWGGKQKPNFPKIPYYRRFLVKTRCEKITTYYLILTIFWIKWLLFTSNISYFKLNQMMDFCIKSKVFKLTYQLIWTLESFFGFFAIIMGDFFTSGFLEKACIVGYFRKFRFLVTPPCNAAILGIF